PRAGRGRICRRLVFRPEDWLPSWDAVVGNASEGIGIGPAEAGRRRRAPRPPPAAEYDCTDGYFGWQLAWTADKKKWCCNYEQRGCTTSTTSALAVDASHQYGSQATLEESGTPEGTAASKPSRTTSSTTPVTASSLTQTSTDTVTTNSSTSTTSTTSSSTSTTQTTSTSTTTTRTTSSVPECDVDCYLQGARATCAQRGIGAAKHRFQRAGGDRCVAAADFVKDLCPSCYACPLKA
ncbi:unnamed protein product, partial [Prorocentrum cordatum]